MAKYQNLSPSAERAEIFLNCGRGVLLRLSNQEQCKQFQKDLLDETKSKMILKNSEIFRGMSYGDYLREWLIWLHSDSPIYRGHRHEICYAHGNLRLYIRQGDRSEEAG